MSQDVSSTHSTPTLKTTEEESTGMATPQANMSKDAVAKEKRTLFRSCMVVAACTVAMIVNVANATSASISVPTIAKELHVSPIDIVWIVSAYPLSSGCLLLLFGRLADLYGRKMTFSIGNLWLVGFTLGCAFADSPTTLSILRGLQGVGAAATIPASLGILAHHFPPSRARSIAFATFAAGAPVGGSFGTTLGGALVQLTKKTWRSPFYLNSGLAFLSLLIGFLFIEQDRPSEEPDRRVDWIGAFLATAGLTLIIFVLGQGEVAPHQWSTGYIIGLMVTGVIMLVLFILWQHHLEKAREGGLSPDSRLRRLPTPPPLMKLSLWTRANGRVAVVMCIAFLNWCCFLSWSYWTTLYYQDYLGLSPVHTMLRLLPMPITGIACNVIVALFVGRLPFVILMAVGTALTSTAALLFAVINPSAVYWAFGFPAAVVSVVGADFVFAAGTLFIAKVSLPHEQSLAGGVFQCMTQLGTSLGITISTVVSDRVAAKESDRMESYKAAQWTNLGFGILAVSLSIVWLRGIGPIGHNSKTASSDDAERAKVANKMDKEEVEEVKKPIEGVVDIQVRDATSKRAPEESSL